jgi:hypothetical protein
MKTSGSQKAESPSERTDGRIKELGDWFRGQLTSGDTEKATAVDGNPGHVDGVRICLDEDRKANRQLG